MPIKSFDVNVYLRKCSDVGIKKITFLDDCWMKLYNMEMCHFAKKYSKGDVVNLSLVPGDVCYSNVGIVFFWGEELKELNEELVESCIEQMPCSTADSCFFTNILSVETYTPEKESVSTIFGEAMVPKNGVEPVKGVRYYEDVNCVGFEGSFMSNHYYRTKYNPYVENGELPIGTKW